MQPETHEHDHSHSHPHGHAHDHSRHDHDDHDHPHYARRTGGGGAGRVILTALAIAVLGLLVLSICFFVDQTEYVYVTEFGKPVRLCVEPGLQFKMPYQSVRRLDRRIQMASPPGSQMLTRDRPRSADDSDSNSRDHGGTSLGGPPLSVDWYVCWRLPTRQFASVMGKEFEPSVLRFVQSVGSITGAHDRLRERIDSMLKAKVGQMSLTEFVSLNASDIKLDQVNRELTDQIRRDAIDQFGIEVVDVRIKRFNHPEGVKPAIFDMIRAERQGVAERYRAEGKSEAAKIRSLADTERAQILSKAQADAERLRGEGDADAMRIAAEAHGQDPQFYQLLKTLDTYRAILNEKTTIVLSSDSPLLKLLTEGMPKLTNPAKPPRQAGSPSDEKPAASSGAASGNGKSESERNP
jgi:membrane protease subunit HflC